MLKTLNITAEEFSRLTNQATIDMYEEYLSESEDKVTSGLREDTFINGFRLGMKFVALLIKKQVEGESK